MKFIQFTSMHGAPLWLRPKAIVGFSHRQDQPKLAMIITSHGSYAVEETLGYVKELLRTPIQKKGTRK